MAEVDPGQEVRGPGVRWGSKGAVSASSVVFLINKLINYSFCIFNIHNFKVMISCLTSN